MNVYDGRSHIAGRQCMDNTNLVVSILSITDDIDWISLNIEIIAAATIINIAESLRLIVLFNPINNPTNIDLDDPNVNITFIWTENTNQLTTLNINTLNRNINDESNGNLIMSPGVLEPVYINLMLLLVYIMKI